MRRRVWRCPTRPPAWRRNRFKPRPASVTRGGWLVRRHNLPFSTLPAQIINFILPRLFMERAAAPAGRGPSARRRLGRQARGGLAPREAGRDAATPPRPAQLRRTAQPGLQPPETAGSRKGGSSISCRNAYASRCFVARFLQGSAELPSTTQTNWCWASSGCSHAVAHIRV